MTTPDRDPWLDHDDAGDLEPWPELRPRPVLPVPGLPTEPPWDEVTP